MDQAICVERDLPGKVHMDLELSGTRLRELHTELFHLFLGKPDTILFFMRFVPVFFDTLWPWLVFRLMSGGRAQHKGNRNTKEDQCPQQYLHPCLSIHGLTP